MPVRRYKKKPREVDAIQYLDNPEEVADFVRVRVQEQEGELLIYTSDGTMHVQEGFYIVKGTYGGYYSCDPELFESRFEEIK